MAAGNSQIPTSQQYFVQHSSYLLQRASKVGTNPHKTKAFFSVCCFRLGRRFRDMASTSVVSMAMPLTSSATQEKRRSPLSSGTSFLKPLNRNSLKAAAAASTSSRSNMRRFQVKASLKEKLVAGLTAATVSSYMVLPEVAEAAGSGVSPSLKNFLLSIAAGGVVVGAILGAIIGVSNFDPVKRG